MKTLTCTLTLVLLLAVGTAQAGIIASEGGHIFNDSDTMPATRINGSYQFGDSGGQAVALLWFELPDLDPNQLVTADVSTWVAQSIGWSNTEGDADLWAVTVDADTSLTASEADAAYLYGQDTLSGGAIGTKIAEAYIPAGSSPGSGHSLDAAEQATLISYLQANYAVGDYLLMRLTYDDSTPGAGAIRPIESAASKYVQGEEPQLTLEIPEPTTMGLLGLGGLVALKRRRTA